MLTKCINRSIQDILRNGYDGIGKPEPLKGNLSGWWSRRIDDNNRGLSTELIMDYSKLLNVAPTTIISKILHIVNDFACEN